VSDSVTLLASASLPATDAWSASPLPPHLREAAAQLIAKLDERQRFWLSGYLAGFGAAMPLAANAPIAVANAPSGTPAVTVLYGSQGGNSEVLARRAGEALRARGVNAAVLDMLQCTKADLVTAQSLLVVVSTYGEGDPPDSALPLWELLESRKAPSLAGKSFSVLALGDSSYQKFCETGKRFDAKLEALGASRLHARVDCDIDFEASASVWIDHVVGKVSAATGAVATAAVAVPTASVSSAYTRRNPFAAELLVNQRLTTRFSSKDVRHLELSLSGSNMRYEPGDSIGVVPRNPAGRVDALLEALPFDPETPVAADSKTLSFRDFLIERADIGLVDSALLKSYAEAVGSASLAASPADGETGPAGSPAHPRSWRDLVREHPPAGLDCATFAALLRPLAPRLYSIASSLAATPDEAHLTVSITEFETPAGRQLGLVSGMLAATEEGATLPVYLQRNAGFRLPGPDRPIIMIGPGTGVAPFRAFVAEREAVGARGRNWLFFGERSFEHDFLYQVEWLGWRKSGLLTRMDVAFSRDQAQKSYVQHRLLERGAEVWSWLQDGAYVYVCGDASSMAPDVHAALLEIVAKHGGHEPEAAAEYVQQLQRNRRYQRDVY
jgi:sulfite reductase (NADPH) flavoprotein alpha-component